MLKNTLRQLRLSHEGMSQSALAEALGISRQTVYAIEKGKFNPSVKLALEIARYFDTQVENIFYLEDN